MKLIAKIPKYYIFYTGILIAERKKCDYITYTNI